VISCVDLSAPDLLCRHILFKANDGKNLTFWPLDPSILYAIYHLMKYMALLKNLTVDAPRLHIYAHMDANNDLF
jgi:hypothetical protein